MDDKSDATINIADSIIEADKGLLFYHGRLSLLMTSKATFYPFSYRYIHDVKSESFGSWFTVTIGLC